MVRDRSDESTGKIVSILPDSNASRFVYFAAALAALNGLLLGFENGVVSGALLSLRQAFTLSAFQQEMIVSITVIGSIIGAGAGGTLSDRLGRRRVTFATATVFFFGSILLAISPSPDWVLVGRFVLGIAVGVASVMGSLYIAEIAPTSIRGALVTMNQLAISSGILISAITNYYFADAFPASTAWRWMFGASIVPAIVLFAGSFVLPETPRWLVSQGKEHEAREVLTKLRSGGDIDEEIRGIKEVVSEESKLSFREGLNKLLSPQLRPALIVGVGLGMFAQITGIGTVNSYAPTILSSVGFSNSSALFSTVLLDLVALGSVVVSLLVIDKVGRRRMLMVGLTGTASSMAILGLTFLFGLTNIFALLGLLLFKISFAIGISPMFRLIISEIFPTDIRGSADSIMNVIHYISRFIVSATFLSAIQYLGQSATMGVYVVTSIAALVFTYYLVPETKGRSLEEIEKQMREGGFTINSARKGELSAGDQSD